MGSMIHLALGKLEVDWGKNNFYTDHGLLFQVGDLTEIPYYYAGEGWPEGDTITEYKEGFAKKLRTVRDRLELLGYTIDNAREEYERLHREHRIEERPIPFDTLAAALARIDVNNVSANYSEDYDPGKFVRREILDRLSQHTDLDLRGLRADHWEIDLLLENFSAYSALRLLAENPANLDLDVCWGFSDIVEGGWEERSEIQSNPTENKRFLIVTEGSSDAKIIEHAIALLKPHLSDFFRFVDMAEGYPFSGTGNQFRFAKGLVSIGIQNKTVILYDNDAEGIEKYRATAALNLPVNMAALRLPDREQFRAFEAVGPNGNAKADINGKAAAIECYLDLTYKRRSSPLVRWTSFNMDTSTYQGEIEGKSSLMRSFLNLRNIPKGYDASGLKACLDVLIETCVKIAEVESQSRYSE